MARSFSFATFFAISFYLGVDAAWVFDRKKGTTCEAAGVFCLDGTRDTLEECTGYPEYFVQRGQRNATKCTRDTIHTETPRTPRTAQLPCPGGYKCIKVNVIHVCRQVWRSKLVARFHEPCAHDCPEGTIAPLRRMLALATNAVMHLCTPPGSGSPPTCLRALHGGRS